METDEKKLKRGTNTINALGLKEMSFYDDGTHGIVIIIKDKRSN